MLYVVTDCYVLLREKKDNVFGVLDTHDLSVDYVTGGYIIDAIESLGADAFGNVLPNLGFSAILFSGFSSSSSLTIDFMGWYKEPYGVFKYLGSDVRVVFNSSNKSILLDILGNKHILFKVRDLNFSVTDNFYVEYLREFDMFVLHYLFSIGGNFSTKLSVVVSRSGEPQGVFVRGIKPVKIFYYNEVLASYAAKQSLLVGKGWWSGLVCM